MEDNLPKFSFKYEVHKDDLPYAFTWLVSGFNWLFVVKVKVKAQSKQNKAVLLENPILNSLTKVLQNGFYKVNF